MTTGTAVREGTALSVRDLVVEFRSARGVVRAVDGVSLDLMRGETLGIVGESGSGKSTVVLGALGLLPQDSVHRVSGSVQFAGTDLLRAPNSTLRTVRGGDIGFVFQDPSSALNPVLRVGDQIAEALRLHEAGLGSRAASRRAIELLGLVGVPHPDVRARQFPHQFSGGMCQRAVIAMAIANNPRVLVADEPTTAVDVSVQAQLLDLLKKAQRETGAATILITHDMGVIAEAADRLCVMYAGRIVETGPVDQVFSKPRHPYTAGLLACVPSLEGPRKKLAAIEGQPPEGAAASPSCSYAARCPLAQRVCTEDEPTLETWSGPDRASACFFATKVVDSTQDDDVNPESRLPLPQPGGTSQGPLLSVEGLAKRFPVKRGVMGGASAWVRAVDGVSFDVGAGETVGLVGESGCGKSTTAKLIMALEDPTEGEVKFEGRALSQLDRQHLRTARRRLQMVFQDPYSSLNPRLTVCDNVAEPLRLAGTRKAARRVIAKELLLRVGLPEQFVSRLPADLSGGQRQRVAIARALALKPRLVILDEPVSALDVSVQAQVLNLLSDLKSEFGLSYIFVSHDLSVVRYVSDRVVVMYLGKVVEEGPVDVVFGRPRHPYTRALLDSVPKADPHGREQRTRVPLQGELPSPANVPTGCRFRTRCPLASDICERVEPELTPRGSHQGDLVACHFADESDELATVDASNGQPR